MKRTTLLLTLTLTACGGAPFTTETTGDTVDVAPDAHDTNTQDAGEVVRGEVRDDAGDVTEATTPEASTPEASVPEASTPEASVPEASTPETSVPEASTSNVDTGGPCCAVVAPQEPLYNCILGITHYVCPGAQCDLPTCQ